MRPMSKELWIAQRFLMNERGQYTVTGECGAERIMVEIDPSVLVEHQGDPARGLVKIRAKIQSAAREKWKAGETYPVFFTHSGRMKHHAIALTAEDFRA